MDLKLRHGRREFMKSIIPFAHLIQVICIHFCFGLVESTYADPHWECYLVMKDEVVAVDSSCTRQIPEASLWVMRYPPCKFTNIRKPSSASGLRAQRTYSLRWTALNPDCTQQWLDCLYK